MKINITQILMDEHRLILRMIALLERNAERTAKGEYTNWQFYLNGVGFIRNYADRFHHAKEEDVLFKALIKNGMPEQNSPVAAMLMEHDQGRGYVKVLEAATQAALTGTTDAAGEIVANARAYAALLREHIEKEDDVLYPLSERIIPQTMRIHILKGYQTALDGVAPDFEANYIKIIEGYEQEF